MEEVMKKFCLAIGLAGVLAAPTLQAAMSGQITLSTGPNSVGGGEFVATGLGGLSSLGTFSSFCLEHNEYFNPGGTYNATVNDRTISGGVATSGAPGSDPLSMGTAWLYSNFRAGTLAGYNSGLTATAGQLQNAIWWLEGEITTSQAANPFILQIPNNLGWRDYNSAVDANGAWGVVALNLTYPNGGRAQDQLALVPTPVPEPTTMIAGVLLLLPFAASTFRRLRRKA